MRDDLAAAASPVCIIHLVYNLNMALNVDSQNRLYDVVILAGGKGKYAKFTKASPNKNFIKIKNRPLFIHVLMAFLGSNRVGRIYIIGPKADIEAELSKLPSGAAPADKVIPFQESKRIVESIMKTFIASIDGYREGDEECNLAVREKPIVVMCGDAPLLTHQEIDQFLDGCDTDKYDYFLGMTPSATLEYYEPKEGKDGIKMIYTNFAEELLRINNLHIVKPFKVKNRRDFEEMYNMRHLRDFINVLRFGYSLVKRHMKFSDWVNWFKIILAMYLRRMGLTAAADYLRRNITMGSTEKVAGSLLGTRAKIVVTTYGGAAVDVDMEKSVITIENNYDDWMEHQRSHAAALSMNKAD
ncbi:MAG: hypothetical protein IEMM0002_0634 [bacterium]|nr:MAG: hypothetical protein IEMM0002_0634 [bacterium]